MNLGPNNGKFTLIVLPESKYDEKVAEILKNLEKGRRICYVCISKRYTDIIEMLEKVKRDSGDFYFIDAMTSHYADPQKSDNCIFVASPRDIESIRKAIMKLQSEKKCDIIVLDSISSLVEHRGMFHALRLAHELKQEPHHEARKMVILIGEPAGGSDSFCDDIGMLADNIVRVE
jgi:archaellum biogenesis ATPase FlaH